MKKIGVLISGGGSNLQSVIDSTKRKGVLKGIAKVVLVISNNLHAYGLERAQKEGIKNIFIERKYYSDDKSYNAEILKELKKEEVDIVCLAGYMQILGKEVLDSYSGKVLNIHPALLPKYGGKGMYGKYVHEAVVKNKEKESGATVHFADENYDTGNIVIQEKVEISQNDSAQTVAKKVLEVEHKIYPLAIKKVIENIEKKED